MAGEARRRKQAGEKPLEIKIAPRKLAQPVAFVHHERQVRKDERGNEYAIHLYRVVDPATGKTYVEDDTPDGPMPVVIQSVPMLVKKASGLITGPTLVQ